MSVGRTSAAVNLQNVESASQLQMAVAARMLETANVQGEAVVSLVESAAEMMEYAAAQVASASADGGGHLDCIA